MNLNEHSHIRTTSKRNEQLQFQIYIEKLIKSIKNCYNISQSYCCNLYMVLGYFEDGFGGGATLSIASLKFLWNIFFASQKPCFVFPKEFGPAEVGVSL